MAVPSPAVSDEVRPPRTSLRDTTQVCVEAFADYPLIAALFPGDAERRAQVTRPLYRQTLRDCLRHGEVQTAMDGDEIVGVAAWLAPGSTQPGIRRQLPMAKVAWRVLTRFPRQARKGLRAGSVLEDNHPDVPPHWYLTAIAVRPGQQGRGIGGRLLRPMLDRLDDERMPGFLETSDPTNAAWYQRLGFEVTAKVPVWDGGPTIHFLWREPR